MSREPYTLRRCDVCRKSETQAWNDGMEAVREAKRLGWKRLDLGLRQKSDVCTKCLTGLTLYAAEYLVSHAWMSSPRHGTQNRERLCKTRPYIVKADLLTRIREDEYRSSPDAMLFVITFDEKFKQVRKQLEQVFYPINK